MSLKNVFLLFLLIIESCSLYAPPKQNPKGKNVAKDKTKTKANAKGDSDDDLLDAVLSSPEHREAFAKAKELSSKREELERAKALEEQRKEEQSKVEASIRLGKNILRKGFLSRDPRVIQKFIDEHHPVLNEPINESGETALFLTLGLIVNLPSGELQDAFRDIFAKLLRANVDLNALTKKNETVLLLAVLFENEELVRMLLDAGANPNIQRYDGLTPLMAALLLERVDIAKKLLGKGANPNLRNESGATALVYAMKNRNLDIIHMLIDVEADLNVSDKNGVTPLMRAISADDVDMAKMLIRGGARLDLQDKDGRTALMYVIEGCLRTSENADQWFDIAKMLLDKGVDVNLQRLDGVTPLMAALSIKRFDIAKMLLDKGANPDLQNEHGATALVYAIGYAIGEGNFDIIRMLIDAGADLNLPINNGQTLLMVAINADNIAMAKMLIDEGARLDLQDKDGNTALMHALGSLAREEHGENRSYEIVKYLLRFQANTNIASFTGTTPLIAAVFLNDLELVRMLLENGARVNAQDSSNKFTALTTAIGQRFVSEESFKITKKIIEELLNARADVNLAENSGYTPLMIAVDKKNSEIVDILLRAGADPNLQNNNGITALMIAILREDIDMARVLLAAGANPNMRSADGIAVSAFAVFLLEPLRSEIEKLLGEFGEELKEKDFLAEVFKRLQMQVFENEKKEQDRIKQEEAERLKEEEAVEKRLAEEEQKALAQEKNESRKAELLKKQEERRKQRAAALQRKEQEKQRLWQKREGERAAQKEEEKQIEMRRVRDLIVKAKAQGGYCSAESLEDVRAALNRIAVYIPIEIKERCSSVRKLFNRYEASINIDHIIHVESQFQKSPREDKYKTIFSGGHYEQSIQNLIAYGFVTPKNRVVLPNGCIRYALINNFDESEFVKTVFPGDMAIDQIIEFIISSSVLEESQEKDLMAGNIIIVTAEKNGIRTKNVLKVDFFTKNLTLVSSYPF